jgi:hypothetical protein
MASAAFCNEGVNIPGNGARVIIVPVGNMGTKNSIGICIGAAGEQRGCEKNKQEKKIAHIFPLF